MGRLHRSVLRLKGRQRAGQFPSIFFASKAALLVVIVPSELLTGSDTKAFGPSHAPSEPQNLTRQPGPFTSSACSFCLMVPREGRVAVVAGRNVDFYLSERL